MPPMSLQSIGTFQTIYGHEKGRRVSHATAPKLIVKQKRVAWLFRHATYNSK